MKKLLTYFLFLITNTIFAQAVPNKGFEVWDYYRGTGFETPAHWITNDILTSKYASKYKGHSTTKTNDAHSGSYAVKMQVVQDHGETVNGCIYSTGSVDSLVFFYAGRSNAGFSFGQKATTLNGYYKFTSVSGDSAIFGVTMTKWNKTKNKRDTLVNSIFILGHDVQQYAPFVIPLKYRIPAEQPDTALIVIGIQAGNGKDAHVGTTLYVDDVELGTSK